MPEKHQYPQSREAHALDVNRKHPILSFRNEIDRLFQDWLPFGSEERSNVFMPHVDLEDKKDTIVLHADLPGMQQDDIELSLDDNVLYLRGEKRSEHEKGSKAEGRYHYERSFGRFERAFPLPCKIEEDDIDARFKNGVLTIVLPKNKESLARLKKISVRSE